MAGLGLNMTKFEREIGLRIDGVLRTAELVLDNASLDVAAGLYTFALEEYGKLLLLRNRPLDGAPYWWTNPVEKLQTALSELPVECRLTDIRGARSGSAPDDGLDSQLLSDFEARKGIFFSDFEAGGERIRDIPKVSTDRLGKAIRVFIEVIARDSPKADLARKGSPLHTKEKE